MIQTKGEETQEIGEMTLGTGEVIPEIEILGTIVSHAADSIPVMTRETPDQNPVIEAERVVTRDGQTPERGESTCRIQETGETPVRGLARPEGEIRLLRGRDQNRGIDKIRGIDEILEKDEIRGIDEILEKDEIRGIEVDHEMG